MGLVLWTLSGNHGSWLHVNTLTRIAWLLGLTLAGALSYFLVLAATGLRPRHFLRRD